MNSGTGITFTVDGEVYSSEEASISELLVGEEEPVTSKPEPKDDDDKTVIIVVVVVVVVVALIAIGIAVYVSILFKKISVLL